MRARIAACAATCAVAVASMGVAASAATGPPPPKTHGGASATLFATGMKNPTSFAWGDGAMFAGDSGGEGKVPNGGLYIVANGTATEIPGGPLFVGGLAWHDNALYMSAAFLVNGAPSFQIDKWSGFNGTTFTTQKTLFTGPAGFQGFNGITFGPGGRLLVGVDAGLLNGNDHGPASTSPDLYDILSMTASGTDVKVFASGMRQPWQMAVDPDTKAVFVSDLGQDGPKSVEKLGPPDFLLKVRQGQNYGFPTCNHTSAGTCKGDATPFKEFPAHTDIMGLAVMGKTLYAGSFAGLGGKGGGALYKMGLHGGKATPVVTGFPLATDALAAHGGSLYVGGSGKAGGVIYQVTP
jgi:glucose/arabinose dehydrogenase